jgi:hypothetical protein
MKLTIVISPKRNDSNTIRARPQSLFFFGINSLIIVHYASDCILTNLK